MIDIIDRNHYSFGGGEERTDAVLAALDAALRPSSLRDLDLLELSLIWVGWEPGPVEDAETRERRWTAPGIAAEGVSAAVWAQSIVGSGVSFALIAGAATEAAAEELWGALRRRIASRAEFRALDSEGPWSNWSDGERTACLALHRGSVLDGTTVLPSVQVGIDPERRHLPARGEGPAEG